MALAKLSLVMTATLLSAAAWGQSPIIYVCENGASERRVEVRYPSGQPLPCEVHYSKSGTTELLWSAQNTPGYCRDKAQTFVAQQRQWGWQCQPLDLAPSDAAPAVEPEPLTE
ncbi:hypothetical protein [uncultured Ferrimonas sp.]|uniref:hypothetical protein n=1 Tax=uncultured Ferrimonas sp. TaxID=432640 RepID=UPI002620B569|nr:hypothetical protein [uncultured Ferrimonas sp.]